MLAEQRRNRLLELIRDRRFASLPELVEQLGVSESTIRRDLECLEEQGSPGGSMAGSSMWVVRQNCRTSMSGKPPNGA